MDGSSCSIYKYENDFGVCSRNLELKENDKNTFWNIARKLNLNERLTKFQKDYKRNIMLQGEVCGEGIQKNKDKLKGQNIYIFDIFDIDEKRNVSTSERVGILSSLNEMDTNNQIHHVPLLEIINIFEIYPTLEEILQYADGPGLNSKTREGIVCKLIPKNESKTIVSFKVINNKYLLKNND